MNCRWWTKKRLLSLISLLIIIAILPFLVKLTQKVQRIFLEAIGEKAEIVIDIKTLLPPLNQPWKAFAQGGEDSQKPMLREVIDKVSKLKPAYIRLDHLYDFYQIVRRQPDNSLTFDFSRLDETVNHILATGAKPFFSLSYMPKELGDDLVSNPRHWEEWQLLVQKTIEHYSGKGNKNLSGVYYEVWNEPDLFGNWRTYEDKNYLDLYYYSAKGAQQASNVNSFKLGGPATTGLYKNWIENLLKFCQEKGLRIDFVSWHRYDEGVERFVKDIEEINQWLASFPQYVTLEKIISEWGHNPEIDNGYDGIFAAVHNAAVLRQLVNKVNWVFTFEIKDGKSKEGKTFWGRWGLLTHEDFGKREKPRYFLFPFLNDLGVKRLSLTGEGTWVTALATKKEETINLLLINYDRFEQHAEAVPISFTNLDPGIYRYGQKIFLGEEASFEEEIKTSSTKKIIYMPPNSIALLQLTKLATPSASLK